MTWLKRLFGAESEPRQRVRICVECGMPVADHKSWCPILQGQEELKRRGLDSAARASDS